MIIIYYVLCHVFAALSGAVIGLYIYDVPVHDWVHPLPFFIVLVSLSSIFYILFLLKVRKYKGT